MRPGPCTGFNDGGGQGPVFDDGGGQGPQISNFPQNHKGPPLCANRDLRFRGGHGPPAPLYTGLDETKIEGEIDQEIKTSQQHKIRRLMHHSRWQGMCMRI